MSPVGNTRYAGLAIVDLEKANNWLTQLFHLNIEDVYTSHEQTLEAPENWSVREFIEDNRRRIQDATNLLGQLPCDGPQETMIIHEIMISLMNAKMWLGNQLDLEMKVKAAQSSIQTP